MYKMTTSLGHFDFLSAYKHMHAECGTHWKENIRKRPDTQTSGYLESPTHVQKHTSTPVRTQKRIKALTCILCFISVWLSLLYVATVKADLNPQQLRCPDGFTLSQHRDGCEKQIVQDVIPICLEGKLIDGKCFLSVRPLRFICPAHTHKIVKGNKVVCAETRSAKRTSFCADPNYTLQKNICVQRLMTDLEYRCEPGITLNEHNECVRNITHQPHPYCAANYMHTGSVCVKRTPCADADPKTDQYKRKGTFERRTQKVPESPTLAIVEKVRGSEKEYDAVASTGSDDPERPEASDEYTTELKAGDIEISAKTKSIAGLEKETNIGKEGASHEIIPDVDASGRWMAIEKRVEIAGEESEAPPLPVEVAAVPQKTFGLMDIVTAPYEASVSPTTSQTIASDKTNKMPSISMRQYGCGSNGFYDPFICSYYRQPTVSAYGINGYNGRGDMGYDWRRNPRMTYGGHIPHDSRFDQSPTREYPQNADPEVKVTAEGTAITETNRTTPNSSIEEAAMIIPNQNILQQKRPLDDHQRKSGQANNLPWWEFAARRQKAVRFLKSSLSIPPVFEEHPLTKIKHQDVEMECYEEEVDSVKWSCNEGFKFVEADLTCLYMVRTPPVVKCAGVVTENMCQIEKRIPPSYFCPQIFAKTVDTTLLVGEKRSLRPLPFANFMWAINKWRKTEDPLTELQYELAMNQESNSTEVETEMTPEDEASAAVTSTEPKSYTQMHWPKTGPRMDVVGSYQNPQGVYIKRGGGQEKLRLPQMMQDTSLCYEHHESLPDVECPEGFTHKKNEQGCARTTEPSYTCNAGFAKINSLCFMTVYRDLPDISQAQVKPKK